MSAHHDADDRAFMAHLTVTDPAKVESLFSARSLDPCDGRATEIDSTAVESPLMLPLCSALLADGHVCLLPLVDGHSCPHRPPGAAPAAVADLVAELRRQVSEARTIAAAVAAELRHLHGDRGVAAVLRRGEPPWLAAGA
jgi:hypothetical protein